MAREHQAWAGGSVVCLRMKKYSRDAKFHVPRKDSLLPVQAGVLRLPFYVSLSIILQPKVSVEGKYYGILYSIYPRASRSETSCEESANSNTSELL